MNILTNINIPFDRIILKLIQRYLKIERYTISFVPFLFNSLPFFACINSKWQI